MTGSNEITGTPVAGDADPAALARVFGDPSRVRVLMALTDGRALPASVLAGEAGVSPPAASSHLAKLLDAGMVTVERSGRHRYYRLADERVAAVIEAMSRLAPAQPISSLRQSSRAHALREARTCYDHLAGRLGVALTASLIRSGALVPRDGVPTTARRPGEPLSAQLGDGPHGLGPRAAEVLNGLGVDLEEVRRRHPRRDLLRFCMDWSEQQHHLAGALGAELCSTLVERGWVRRRSGDRAVTVTEEGRARLETQLAG